MILLFTIGAGGTERKARDSNPHPPRGGTALAGRLGKPYPTTFRSSGPTGSRTRISATPGRRRPLGPWALQSLCLRSAQWTAGESNPDLRRAMPASSRWTSSPYARMNRHGNRTPLLRDPFSREDPPAHSHEGPPENRTRSPSLPRRCAAGTPADRLFESRPGRTRTCAILCVRQASWPLDDGTNCGQ